MISNEQFRTYLKGKLDINLYADYGEFERSYRDHNEVIVPTCGIFKMQPMTVTPLQGLFLASATGMVEIAAEVDRVAQIRALIDELAATCNGETVTMVDEDGKTYLVTFSYSTAYVGVERTAPNNTGKMIPVSMTVYCSIIQNGVSSCDVQLELDGEPIFFTEFIASHQRVADSYATDEGTTKAAILQGGRSFDFVSPLLSSALGAIYRKAIFEDDGNNAHCFTVTIDGKTYGYIGIFGNMSASAQAPQNVGCNISILEGDPEAVTFGEGWTKLVAVGQFRIPAPSTGEKNIVFWGDGNVEVWDTTKGELTSLFHNYADNTLHTIRYFTARKNATHESAQATPDSVYNFRAEAGNMKAIVLTPDSPDELGGYWRRKCKVDFGDGRVIVYDTMSSSDMPTGVSHTYNEAGTYEIKIYNMEEPVWVSL